MTPMADAEHYVPAHEWEPVTAFPGWRFAKRLDLANPLPRARDVEPIEVDVEFRADQVTDLAREVRVAAVGTDGALRQVPSQVHGDIAEDDARRCRLFFLASLPPQATATYLVLYGNPDAPAPPWETDLTAAGRDYALDVENRYYRVELAKSMGHLKSLAFKQGGAGGGPVLGKEEGLPYRGHGVEGSIHHNPDWSDEQTGRYRVTSWVTPPEFEVIRGPVCVRTRRRGHPILALGPGIGRSDRVVAEVTYTFFAAVPYVLMESRLEVLEDVRFSDCRNDEWVGIGRDLPEAAWRMKDGQIGFGMKSWSRQDPAWITLFNRQTGHGFASVRLAYECTHPDWHEPAVVALGQDWGGLWVRYPLRHALMRAGDFVHERNAYLLHRYDPSATRDAGFGDLSDWAAALAEAPTQEPVTPSAKPLTAANVRDALGSCCDAEVYVKGTPYAKRRLSYLDLGWVRSVRLDGAEVAIDLVLPYAGREVSFGWFAQNVEQQIRARVDGVGAVRVALVRDPPWSPAQMTQRGRRALGL